MQLRRSYWLHQHQLWWTNSRLCPRRQQQQQHHHRLYWSTTTLKLSSMTTTTTTTTRQHRSWPAEWSPHAACILLYPHNSGTFRLDQARSAFLAVAHAISQEGDETVLVFCQNHELRAQVVESVHRQMQEQQQEQQNDNDDSSNTNNSRIIVLECDSNDTWARDTAPTFVVQEQHSDDIDQRPSRVLVGLDWDFNAYGGEFEGTNWPCTADQQVAGSMCQEINRTLLPVQHEKISLILEGGAIHTDGEGTILTTKECLLNPNRNPGYSQEAIETTVLEATGCSKMIWLENGLAFDNDTNGHIDNWACFTAPGNVVLCWTDNANDDPINYERCRAALSVLETVTDAQGRSLTVHKLDLPHPMFYTTDEVMALQYGTGDAGMVRQVGERLAGSYANFYIANHAVIVPQFGQVDMDARAIATLQTLFHNRKVVGIPTREILIGGGNIHCITQQIPNV